MPFIEYQWFMGIIPNTQHRHFRNFGIENLKIPISKGVFFEYGLKGSGIMDRFPHNVFLFKMPFLYLHSDFGKRYQYSCTQL